MSVDAWLGDWYTRIEERVRERGFDTVTAFVDTQPTTYLVELAHQLGQGDVAASQLERMLILEAEEAGTIQRCARNLLVRELHKELPEGWPAEWHDEPRTSSIYRLISATSDVYCVLPDAFQDSFDRVRNVLWKMLDGAPLPDDWISKSPGPPIPIGWLPHSPDDPILLQLFKYWDAPAEPEPDAQAVNADPR